MPALPRGCPGVTTGSTLGNTSSRPRPHRRGARSSHDAGTSSGLPTGECRGGRALRAAGRGRGPATSGRKPSRLQQRPPPRPQPGRACGPPDPRVWLPASVGGCTSLFLRVSSPLGVGMAA
ncbi:hypothetical protein HJG60_010419 [Phyllostomus discolor]|uniref:Uncharacterized protein n=1 Tax=Phyllostomus discolor TaxID=89673 RepID=A0A834AT42_9CHIR|nr:hypothetical protein HJG60_010419 [Phyllostomus discolor]